MKTIINSFKHILQNRDSSVTKIILLGVALAVSIVLVAKIYFENSYESYVPQIDRVYRVLPIYTLNGKAETSYHRVSGGIVGKIAEYSPFVELATRYRHTDSDVVLKRYDAAHEQATPTLCKKIVVADSSLFDFFATKTYGAQVREILSTKRSAMLSRSMAQKMSPDGDPRSMIGVVVVNMQRENSQVTIEGIFDDFPRNSDMCDTDLIISLPTIGEFSYDGSNNLVGNDSYIGYVKLLSGAQTSDVEPAIKRLIKEDINTLLAQWGISNSSVNFRLAPLKSYHSSQPDVRLMTNMLLILAFALLVVAMLNYVLIAVSAFVKRARSIAMHKCYGASRWVIYRMFIADAVAALMVALALVSLLILALKSQIEFVVDIPLVSLFNIQTVVIVIILSLFVVVVCGVVPASIYASAPISAVFRKMKESKRLWKHGLLALQFSGAMFFISLLVIVALQYHNLLTLDMGYDYSKITTVSLRSLNYEEKLLLKEELSKIAGVEGVTLSANTPLVGSSGNNAYLEDDINATVHIADQYSADENFVNIYDIDIIEGRNFSSNSPIGREILVSREFAKQMSRVAKWDGSVIGKEVEISEHNDVYTICGVYRDYMISNAVVEFSSIATSPTVIFFDKTEGEQFKNYYEYISIKGDVAILSAVNDRLARLFPDRMLEAENYSAAVKASYSESKKFRDLVFFSGVVVLIITFIGLIGYLTDEINRRRSEIAIRKIHGATITQIVKLFAISVLKLILVGIVVGGISSYYLASRWLEQFSLKIDLSIWLFILGAFMVSVIAFIVVLTSTYKNANLNPVKNLHNN